MYPPGNGQPPGYQGMYAPPPPGFFGTTAAGMGYGGGFHGQQQAQQAGGAMFAGGAVSAMSSVPTGLANAVATAGMVAPFMAAGSAGFGAKMAWNAVDNLDPFTQAFKAGGMGARGGFAAGSQIMGLGKSARLAGIGSNVGMMGRVGGLMSHAATTGGGWASRGGARAAMGMGARIAGAGMMGVGGAVGAAALPAAAGMAAYAGLEYAGKQMYQGASNTMQGQALMNNLGPSVAPGQDMKGQGAATGKMMQGLSQDLGVGVEDIGRYAKQLDSQKVFQTTRSAKEFRTKLKTVMKSVKEIAEITKGTVDDAMQMFTDMRQSGFHTTADMKAQAATRTAREMTTGISSGVFSAVGGAGSQMARQQGMRGRHGAKLAERNVASVAMGVRSGSMSEEEVMEMGGAEQVGLRMSQKQMSFMKSSRGRAMIAYSMGKGGAPDQGRLGKLLGGASMEDIVTGAASRGLGTLRAAGGREAQENFMPYAGMAMVSMAAAQQKQIYGGTSRKGIIGMMGTMGVGREESELMLQQTLGMPEQLRKEQRAKEESLTRASAQARYANSGIRKSVGRWMERNVGEGMRATGNSMYGSIGNSYTRNMESMFGGKEYRGGDEDTGREYLQDLRKSGKELEFGSSSLNKLGASGAGWAGSSTAKGRIREQYSEYTTSRGEAGEDAVDVGRGKFINRGVLAKAEQASERGRKAGLSEKEQTNLQYAVGKGNYLAREKAARGEYFKRNDKERTGLDGTGNPAWKAGEVDRRIKEHGNYFAASEAGLDMGGAGSFEDYLKLDKDKRTEIGQRVAGGMGAAAEGEKDSGKLLASVDSAGEKGLGTLENLQASRDSFESGMAKYLAGGKDDAGSAAARAQGFGGVGSRPTTGQQQLASEMRDGTKRKAYLEYQQALASGDKDKINKARENAEGILGDEAFQEARAGERRLDEDSEYKAQHAKDWAKDGDQSKAFGQRSAEEVAATRMGRIKKGFEGFDINEDLEGEDSGFIASMHKLEKSGSSADVEAVLRNAITSRGEDGSLISEKERASLGDVSGGQSGAILSMAEKLAGGGTNEKERGNLGMSKAEAEAIREADPAEQGQMIVEALKKANLLNMDGDGTDGGVTGVQGTQTEYVQANTKFVAAVEAFIASLPDDVVKSVEAKPPKDGANTKGVKSDWTKPAGS